ncbi:MAG: hypothetical protein ACHQ6V_17915 [Myxococcota bacterium]
MPERAQQPGAILRPALVDVPKLVLLAAGREQPRQLRGESTGVGLTLDACGFARVSGQHIRRAGAAQEEQGAIAGFESRRAQRRALHLEPRGRLAAQRRLAFELDAAGVDARDPADRDQLGLAGALVQSANRRRDRVRHLRVRSERRCDCARKAEPRGAARELSLHRVTLRRGEPRANRTTHCTRRCSGAPIP